MNRQFSFVFLLKTLKRISSSEFFWVNFILKKFTYWIFFMLTLNWFVIMKRNSTFWVCNFKVGKGKESSHLTKEKYREWCHWFLHADKHQSSLQVEIFFSGFGQACCKYPDKFAITLRYLKKEVKNEVAFLCAGECQVFHKLILSFLAVVARFAQNTKNNKFGISEMTR